MTPGERKGETRKELRNGESRGPSLEGGTGERDAGGSGLTRMVRFFASLRMTGEGYRREHCCSAAGG